MSERRDLEDEEPQSVNGKNASRNEKKYLLQLIMQEDKNRVINRLKFSRGPDLKHFVVASIPLPETLLYIKILIESKGVSDVKAKRAAIWERVKARFNAKQEVPWSLKKLKDLRCVLGHFQTFE